MVTNRASTQKVLFWQKIGGLRQGALQEKFATWGFADRAVKIGFKSSGKNRKPANLCQIWLACGSCCLAASVGEAPC